MWKKLYIVLLSLFVFSFVPVAAQEACKQDIQDSYLSIRSKLTDLKANSERVTEQLLALSESLELSQQEAATWKQASTRLSESWMSINEQLESCYATMEQQRATIETQSMLLKKTRMELLICMGLLILMAVRAVIKCLLEAGLALYANGGLPSWLSRLFRRNV